MSKQEQSFQDFLLDWYEKAGRHDLPWRSTADPYKILVSELMLQQTQVRRVLPKYEHFISTWSTVDTLAEAPLSAVLQAWQGLGYNRRAKFLHECAKTISTEYSGVFPDTEANLKKLPGIGPYTAAAVCAFAYNQPVLLVETNVRQVYIHHFFKDKTEVTDTEILEKVKRTMPPNRAAQWYAALMDYGTHLKSLYGNNTQRVKGYVKQSTFKGSNREVRGAILRILSKEPLSTIEIKRDLATLNLTKVEEQLMKLKEEELIIKEGRLWKLPS